jgi:vacuolar iron transporter family protein
MSILYDQTSVASSRKGGRTQWLNRYKNPMIQSRTTQLLSHLQDELDGATLYQGLAAAERNPQLAELYRRLAAVEQRHAETWIAQLQAANVTPPPFRPAWRTRALLWLARRFGVETVLPTIVAQEQSDAHGYDQLDGAATMSGDERTHARLLRHIGQSIPGGMEGSALAQLEGRHRAGGGNALRAAVLGANDGLVSNLSLVMGVAGAELAGNAILVTGLAGLLAGACSMALGEWLSVQSSRELYQKQIEIERAEIAASPEEEAEELALIYQARGVEEAQARQLAGQIMSNQATALETLVREELSIDPAELGGSAWVAAITSFVLFAIGAILPVIPFIFLSGMTAVTVSLLLSTVGLFVIGAGITLFTGRGLLFSGARQVIFGLAAAAVTYGIGWLIGVNLAG